MSQTLAGADGIPLFACTKCNSRHPFEDLSQGHQLCKNCKGSFQVVKCNYCRTEFQQETNGTNNGTAKSGSSSSSSICKKCDHLQQQHGKPGPCAYCNIIAAFIGTKCQRCTNSEKKYGPPMSCEHCRQKCAFDRKDPESKRKVDGKLLCWLCTMAFKRTLAKARQKEAILTSTLSNSGSSGNHHRIGGDSKLYSSSSRHHGTSNSNGQRHNNSGSNSNVAGSSNSTSLQRSSSNRRSQQNSSHSNSLNQRDSSSSSSNKKARMDISNSSNSHLSSSISSLTETRFIDPNNGDLTAVVAQLKDQLSHLNKRLQIKEKELLSKDQQIADLKSTSTREHRELREKINTIQRQHQERISEMQAKLVTMQKQLAAQSKATRTNPQSGYVEPPVVI